MDKENNRAINNRQEYEALTPSELQIMRVIWDEPEPLAIPELTRLLKEKYDRDYARTTIVTFLTSMKSKGYVHTKRAGKLAYVYTDKTEREHLHEVAKNSVDTWFAGSAAGFFMALYDEKGMSTDDLKKAKEYLDELANLL